MTGSKTSPAKAASRLGPAARLILTAGVALLLSGAPQASADQSPQNVQDGPKVWIGDIEFLQFNNIDLANPSHRALMLTRVEEAASSYCKSLMMHRSRCVERTVEKAMNGAPPAVEQAIALAQTERSTTERNTVAQAMR